MLSDGLYCELSRSCRTVTLSMPADWTWTWSWCLYWRLLACASRSGAWTSSVPITQYRLVKLNDDIAGRRGVGKTFADHWQCYDAALGLIQANTTVLSHGLVLSGANSISYPEGPTITRLGTESEDDVFFILYSITLCQGWVLACCIEHVSGDV